MPSITISSDSGCGAEVIAAKAGEVLGYQYVGPGLFDEAADRYGLPRQCR